MKQLIIGKISTKELTDWFGKKRTQTITQNNWNNKYINVLSNYCRFEKVYGGIDVKEIYCDEFVPFKDKVRDYLNQNFDKEWNKDTGLDSVSDVIERMVEKEPWLADSQQGGYSLTTLKNLGVEYRNKFYGKPFHEEGELGICKYVLCTRDKQTGELRFLTDEEQALKKETFDKYFIQVENAMILVQQLVDEGQVSRENAWAYYETITARKEGGWGAFFKEMKDKDCILYRGTIVTRNGFKYIIKADEFKWE